VVRPRLRLARPRPTNAIPAGDDHIFVARGRDYSDVPPVEGLIVSSGAHALEVEVDVIRFEGKGAAVPSEPNVVEADIRAAYAVIAPHVRRTPLIEAASPIEGRPPISLKLEFLQHAGSFKPRGAFHNLLTRAAPPVGCATARAATTAPRSPTPPASSA